MSIFNVRSRPFHHSFFLFAALVLLLILTSAFITQVTSPTFSYLPIVQASGVGSCSDAHHDPDEWHPLHDSIARCHYDHEHKHNPNDVADIFGPAGDWFNGTSLSYPWQTPAENEFKHEAYSWIVRRDIPSNGRDIWISDFRWLVHATGAPFTKADGTLHGGYLGRFHSHSLEARVCRSSGECGLVRTGGWIDYGNLELDGVDDCVVLPSDPTQQETCNKLGRRRIHFYYTGSDRPQKSTFFWYGRAGLLGATIPALHPVQVAVATQDNSVNIIPGDLYSLNFFCPAWDCNLNNSTIQAHVIGFRVPAGLDFDGNGLVNFNGFTDRYGVIDEECSVAGQFCVPLILYGAPIGLVQHRDDLDLGLGPEGIEDFDTSSPGLWWIDYPEPKG